MDAKQHLYYAIGIMAYAVAKADGHVQEEEKDKLQQIVEEEIDHSIDFGYANIIFQILEKDDQDVSGLYSWIENALSNGKHYLTDELKVKIKVVLSKVAEAFPPTTTEETEVKTKLLEIIDDLGEVNLPLE